MRSSTGSKQSSRGSKNWDSNLTTTGLRRQRGRGGRRRRCSATEADVSGDQRRRRKERGRAGEVNAQDPAMATVLAVTAVEGEGGEPAADVEEKGRWRRSAAVMVEETGRTEARKGGGRRREQRLSWVASEERAEEIELDEAGGELRRRRNRERRRWQRGRRNRVMDDDFPNSGDGKAERKKPWKRENVAAMAREERKEEAGSRGWRWIPTGGKAAAGDHTARWGRRDRGGRRRKGGSSAIMDGDGCLVVDFQSSGKIVSIRPCVG